MKTKIFNIIKNPVIDITVLIIILVISVLVKLKVIVENPITILYVILFSVILSVVLLIVVPFTLLTRGWKVKIMENMRYSLHIKFFFVTIMVSLIGTLFLFYFVKSIPYMEQSEELYRNGIIVNGSINEKVQKGKDKNKKTYVSYAYTFNGQTFNDYKPVSNTYYDSIEPNDEIEVLILDTEPDFNYPLVDGIDSKEKMLEREKSFFNYIKVITIYFIPFLIIIHFYQLFKKIKKVKRSHKKHVKNLYLEIVFKN